MTERGRENRNDFPQTLSPGHSDINSQKCISKLKCKKKYKRNTNTNTNTNTRELLAQSSPVPAIGKTCKISWHFFRMTAILTLLKRQEEYVWKPKGKTKASYALFLCIQRSFRATQNPETNCLRSSLYREGTNTREIPTQMQKKYQHKYKNQLSPNVQDLLVEWRQMLKLEQPAFNRESVASPKPNSLPLQIFWARWHKYIASANTIHTMTQIHFECSLQIRYILWQT